MGAAEWRKKGLAVPGLTRKLTPHYGVYAPTRTDYVELLSKLDNVKGAKCFDIGTGTGVLALALLQKGAASVIGTDIDSRAVECANDNAKFFKVNDVFKVEERPLFPNGRADIVVCNPPWVPETPKNRVDHAIFDGGGEVLRGFLEGLREHLSGHGRGVLILSDLAVLLGLREPGFLKSEFERCGLQLRSTFSTTAKHGKAKDSDDPLFAVRSKETTSLYVLTAG
jgi:methylase of polypeptide subunit release factors